MDIEDAFSVVGDMGKFQIFQTVVICATNVVYGSQIVLMVIVGATPNRDIPSERNLTTVVTEWDLYNEQWVVDLMSSLFMAGFGVGCVVSGQLSDLFGRKWLFILNYTLLLLSSLCTAFTNSWEAFAALRAMAGLFTGGGGAILFCLMVENLGKQMWGPVGMAYQTFFSVGMMLLSLTGYLLHDWRKITIVSCSLAFIPLPIYIFIVPESSRWLYYVGKMEKAERVLSYIAKWNGRPDCDLSLSSINSNTCTEKQGIGTYSAIDMFKIPKLAAYAACSFYMWFACSFVYYGLTFDAAILSPNIFIALLLSGSIEIPAIAVSYFMIRSRRFGRKGASIVLMMLSAISSTALVFADGVKSDYIETLQTVFGLSSKLAVAGVFSILYIYVCEIFPTQLRLVAFGGSSMFARIGAIISPFIPLLTPTASYLPYAVFGVAAILSGMVNLFLPETLNRKIPDVGDFIEKKDGPTETVTEGSSCDSAKDEQLSPLYSASKAVI